MRDRRNSRNCAGVALPLEALKPETGNGVEGGTALITSNARLLITVALLHTASKRFNFFGTGRSHDEDALTATQRALFICLFYI